MLRESAEDEDLNLKEKVMPVKNLSDEFRQTLRALREEVDPLGIQDVVARSYFEERMREFQKFRQDQEETGLKLPDFGVQG